ncbi:hypothetical protein [Bacillus solitudinis]|uniref:hypothetical protein n=1 Tax=Bacillus solitudinis TaxID=2014074 RepID=UPI000C23A9BD|nr:hypothetical protein [Bacillus solitudinis]
MLSTEAAVSSIPAADSSETEAISDIDIFILEIMYELNGNGGSHDNGASKNWRTTLYSLNLNATSLTLIPKVCYSKASGEGIELTTMKPITIYLY